MQQRGSAAGGTDSLLQRGFAWQHERHRMRAVAFPFISVSVAATYVNLSDPPPASLRRDVLAVFHDRNRSRCSRIYAAEFERRGLSMSAFFLPAPPTMGSPRW